MPALKSHVKCELSTLANKAETMLLNLFKTVNAQQENVNKNIKLFQQNISYLQKVLSYKNEPIKSLLKVQSNLMNSINKSTVNEFRMPKPTMEPQRNPPIPSFNLQNQPTPKYKRQNNHQPYIFRQN